MKKSVHRVNARTVRKMQENEKLTLKNGKKISYSSGWQVPLFVHAVHTPDEAMRMARLFLNDLQETNDNNRYSIEVLRVPAGYQVSITYRVLTRHKAILAAGRYNYHTIYSWKRNEPFTFL